MQDVNLREMFAAFCEVYAPARELTARRHAGRRAEGRAAALLARRRTPDAAGHAGHRRGGGQHLCLQRRGHRQGDGDRHAGRRALIDAAQGAAAGDAALDAAHAPYEAAIAALKPRFELYERANRVNDHPWLADLLIWRANKSARILRRMAGVLEETGNPGNLISLRGITQLFLPFAEAGRMRMTPCASCSA